MVIHNPTWVLHFGPVYNFHFGQAFGHIDTNNNVPAPSNTRNTTEDRKERDKPPKVSDRPLKERDRLPKEMRPYLNSERVIEQEELSMIARNMGSNWKAVGKGLEFQWAQLDQFETDTKSMVDAIQRMLFRWVQWKDQKATVGKLTKVLFNQGEYEAIRVMKP